MDERPFDARATWLCEPDEAPHEWRTVSLVTAVRALLQFDAAPAGRADLLRSCLETLTARGVDGDSLLRFGFLPEVISPLIFRRVISAVLDVDERSKLDAALQLWGVDVAGWELLLGSAHAEPTAGSGIICKCCPEIVDDRLAVAGSIYQMAPLVAWTFDAPLDALLSLSPPNAEDYDRALKRQPPDQALFTNYRWLVDRFSTTSLRDWDEPSLHLEHQYQDGTLPPPVPEMLMADRAVTAEDLNAEIARRAVNPRPRPQEQYGLALARKMQSKAEDLLRDGRRPEAAALFEFALSQQPDDPDAFNNLGFCLLPDDPAQAVKHFRQARSLGYAPLGINVYNEALALQVQGHDRQALQAVEDHWDVVASSPRSGATLWEMSEGQLVLASTGDVRAALLSMCVGLSQAQGGPAADRWLARAAG